VVGFAAVGVGVDAVAWSKVGKIVASWIVSPMLAGTISFFVFRSIQNLIISTETPLKNAIKYGPIYLFLLGFMIALVALKKGLKHIGIDFGETECFIIALLLGVAIALVGAVLIRRVKIDPNDSKEFHYANVEKIFAVMMIFTASAMAFAHGSNDVANAVGPMAAVISTVQSGAIENKSMMPSWVLLVGGLGIVICLATLGYKVIRTVGEKITALTPSRGFSAEISAASTTVLASYTGIPVSTTQILVGAVLGVGFARGIGAIDLRVVGNIFMSWIITLPAGAFLAILFFWLFRAIFS
jgi:PiT family inorganic phosphate transporter